MHDNAAGQEAQYQQVIRQAVQGILLAALHPRTVVQVVLQVGFTTLPTVPCAACSGTQELEDSGSKGMLRASTTLP